VGVVFGHPISGSLEDSGRLLRRALTYDRQNPFALYEMYWTCCALGRTDKALEALHSLCAIPPSNAREQQQHEDASEILKRNPTTQSK
jgi:hypothetical protein